MLDSCHGGKSKNYSPLKPRLQSLMLLRYSQVLLFHIYRPVVGRVITTALLYCHAFPTVVA